MGASIAANTLVDVEFDCAAGDRPKKSDIQRWVRAALAGAGVAGRRRVSVKVVDIDEIRSLNLRFRGQDVATNVLSFEAGPAEQLPAREAGFLGDIAICAAIVQDEAAEQGKAPDEHWAHIIVHGTLHLLGFDHVTDSDACHMEDLEVRILKREGIGDPYRV